MNHIDKNKSIILTAPYLKSGGVYSFVENIQHFFTFKVILFRRGRNPKIKNYIKHFFSFLITPFRFIVLIILNKSKNVVINSSLSRVNLLRDGILILISKLFIKKIVLIIHGFDETIITSYFYNKMLKYGFFCSDVIIVLSSSFSEILKLSGFSKPIYLQYNPVNSSILEAFNPNKKKLKNNLIANFLFLARVEKTKGIFTAINSFYETQKKFPFIKLTVAGTGGALEEAKNYIEENGICNVVFTGFLQGNEKIRVLSEADVLLFPTEHEGLPINVLEAMAAGQVVITRPVGGLIDLYRKINFGFLVESTSYYDFSNIMCKVIEDKDECVSIRENNMKFAQKNFDPRVITMKLEKIIISL